MNYIESEPVFIPYEKANDEVKDKTTAICKCPIPILLPDGMNVHIVDYNKQYICKKCGTIMCALKDDRNINRYTWRN